MKYLRIIWRLKYIIPPAIAILCVLWLTAFYALESWWTKQIFISKTHITWTKTAEAKELTPEEYICTKKWDCKTALAIAKAESGLRCDAQNINKGTNSVDLGIFQVNSVHLKKGWKVAELLDCKKNTDYAFSIYESQGWKPWSAYKSGAYKKHL